MMIVNRLPNWFSYLISPIVSTLLHPLQQQLKKTRKKKKGKNTIHSGFPLIKTDLFLCLYCDRYMSIEIKL